MRNSEDKKVIRNVKMMACGHSPNAVDGNGNPCCVICDCHIVRELDVSVLYNRKAKCSECGRVVDSSADLAFFKCRPDCEYDEFYDGCNGWD